jgi:hypothetical protein
MAAVVLAETNWLWGLIGFIIWILIISWTATTAARKGRSAFLWGLLAFFFSIFALLLVVLMPSKRYNA